jgi:hypothetical protein
VREAERETKDQKKYKRDIGIRLPRKEHERLSHVTLQTGRRRLNRKKEKRIRYENETSVVYLTARGGRGSLFLATVANSIPF